MYDAATPVHIIEPEQDLLRDLSAEVHGDTFVLMPFDETEQVFSKDLKYHANVCAVRALVTEMIEEGDDMGAAWMRL